MSIAPVQLLCGGALAAWLLAGLSLRIRAAGLLLLSVHPVQAATAIVIGFFTESVSYFRFGLVLPGDIAWIRFRHYPPTALRRVLGCVLAAFNWDLVFFGDWLCPQPPAPCSAGTPPVPSYGYRSCYLPSWLGGGVGSQTGLRSRTPEQIGSSSVTFCQ